VWKRCKNVSSFASGGFFFEQKKHTLVAFAAKWEVRVLIPKILLKYLKIKVFCLLVKPGTVQMAVMLEKVLLPTYGMPVICNASFVVVFGSGIRDLSL
jgi:hypothetical protein